MNTQALSSTTAQVINGSRPYLTFDGGITKETTIDGLLGITLSDGTVINSENNTSSTKPIMLPNTGETLADVSMVVPATANSIELKELILANNYWGDDDGDGQGSNGITVVGNLSVNITDRYNQTIGRNDVLDVCNGPYKVVLTSTNGSLTTQYGVPNSRTLTASSATYYINPKADPVICYARPNLQYGKNDEPEASGKNFAGPANIWNPNRGFLVQSINLSSYDRNFPTTGANNLYFDLDIGGSGPLRWPTVTRGGITVTMTPNTNGTGVHVVLTGPAATSTQINSNTPSSVSKPSLPQTFELVGYDSNNTAVVKYGFELKQWFVERGDKEDAPAIQTSWCSSLGYRLAQVKDLTNAVCADWKEPGIDSTLPFYPCGTEIMGAIPASDSNYYQRNIGSGLLAEWGNLMRNPSLLGLNTYITSDTSGGFYFIVSQEVGVVVVGNGNISDLYSFVMCVSP